MKRNIFITFDYELFFGNKTGTLENCITKPTESILQVLEQHKIKATFFIDTSYLIKLHEHSSISASVKKDYSEITSQIKKIYKLGHCLQLHIHPHWEDSSFDGQDWVIVTKRYRLHDFNDTKILEIIKKNKKILTDIVGETVFTYRAGGWCIQPFEKIKEGLKRNKIWLDSTLFSGGFNKSKTHLFDFKNMPQKSCWRFENNPLEELEDGSFLEIPISSCRVSPVFYWKLAFTKLFGRDELKIFGDGKSIAGSKWDKLRMLTTFSNIAVSLDGFKASLVQKVFESYVRRNEKNFVIISHPKAMSQYSLNKLEEFIVANKNENFTTFSLEYKNTKHPYGKNDDKTH